MRRRHRAEKEGGVGRLFASKFLGIAVRDDETGDGRSCRSVYLARILGLVNGGMSTPTRCRDGYSGATVLYLVDPGSRVL